MTLQSTLQLLESSPLSTWLRESDSLLAFPTVLILHTLGMAMLAGIAAAVSLRLLNVAPGIPLAALQRFMPVARIGFAINALSGVLLVIAYPAKALTNPIFYAKLLLVALSVATLAYMARSYLAPMHSANTASDSRARTLAIVSLVLWMLTISAGRLLPYTYRQLFAAVG